MNSPTGADLLPGEEGRCFSEDLFLLAEGLHLAPEPTQLLLLLCCEPFSLAGVDLVLVHPAPKGAIRDTDLPGDPGDGVLLIGSSNQPDSFSAKLRRVGRLCSWQCSPLRVLFSVFNSPRNRRKSRGSVEPAIFGTLFERSLDPGERAPLGAHYTSRDDILEIVEPVLMVPLREEWDEIRAEVEALAEKMHPTNASARTRTLRQMETALTRFAEKLRG